MPRKIKSFKSRKIKAALKWKAGDKKSAYKIWEEIAKDRRKFRSEKITKTNAE